MIRKIKNLPLVLVLFLILFSSPKCWSEVVHPDERIVLDEMEMTDDQKTEVIDAASLELEKAPTQGVEKVFDNESEQDEEENSNFVSSL